MIRQCIICYKRFDTNGSRRKCCSKECSNTNKLNLINKYRQTKEGKYNHMMQMRKYRKTDTFKNNLKIYRTTDKYKQYKLKYSQTSGYKQYLKTFRQTDHYKEYIKEYNKTFIAKYNRLKKELRRRERESNCIHAFTREEWKFKCKETNGVCSCCHSIFDDDLHKLTLDHIFAIYWADKHFKDTGKKIVYTIDDVMPLCLQCNSAKCNKLIEEAKPKDLNTPLTN